MGAMEKEVRLIDADKLKQHYAWWEIGDGEITYAEAKKRFDTIIDLQPTVDAERHGRWLNEKMFDRGIYINTIGDCSECGYHGMATNYCPYCGAKMDEVEDG